MHKFLNMNVYKLIQTHHEQDMLDRAQLHKSVYQNLNFVWLQSPTSYHFGGSRGVGGGGLAGPGPPSLPSIMWVCSLPETKICGLGLWIFNCSLFQ